MACPARASATRPPRLARVCDALWAVWTAGLLLRPSHSILSLCWRQLPRIQMLLPTHSPPHHAFLRLSVQTNLTFDSIPRSLVLSYTYLTSTQTTYSNHQQLSSLLSRTRSSITNSTTKTYYAFSSILNKQQARNTSNARISYNEDSTYTHTHYTRHYNTTILPRCLSTGPTLTASTATSRLMEQPTAPNPAGWQSTSNFQLPAPAPAHQLSTDPTTLGPTLPQHPATSSTFLRHTISHHHNAGAQWHHLNASCLRQVRTLAFAP